MGWSHCRGSSEASARFALSFAVVRDGISIYLEVSPASTRADVADETAGGLWKSYQAGMTLMVGGNVSSMRSPDSTTICLLVLMELVNETVTFFTSQITWT